MATLGTRRLVSGICGLLLALGAHGALAQAPLAPVHDAATPRPLPGVLEAAAYDEAGPGTARRPAVSPEGRPNPGQVVELQLGGWLKYTATVKASGLYTLTFRVAHAIGTDPLFRLECDGKDVTGEMNAPYTGGPGHWVTVSRPLVSLAEGAHVFTLKQTGGTPFFLDTITFTARGPVPPGPPPDLTRWQLVWSDEFDKDGAPDPAKWGYDLGGHGWGNKELQYYTDRRENARVERGRLIIEARKEDFKENHYTSARLVTRGKRDFTYGRVEVSARLPKGAGNWPAIWLLGSDQRSLGWPACGEIDIMEHLGRNPGWVHASVHSSKYYFKNGNQLTSLTYVSEPDQAFHVYAAEWFPDRIDFFVDDNKYLTVANEKSGRDAWPFDEPEYLILNVALGGWGGAVVDSDLPARMEVDYVRVYERK
jgi:beta-glucanase (GH16 family)